MWKKIPNNVRCFVICFALEIVVNVSSLIFYLKKYWECTIMDKYIWREKFSNNERHTLFERAINKSETITIFQRYLSIQFTFLYYTVLGKNLSPFNFLFVGYTDCTPRNKYWGKQYEMYCVSNEIHFAVSAGLFPIYASPTLTRMDAT